MTKRAFVLAYQGLQRAAAAGTVRRLCFAGLATMALPSCILLNATSDWHAEAIPASDFATVKDRTGFGLIAADTDAPIYVEDFDPVARHTSRWCWSHRGAALGPALDPAKASHQALAMIRIPAGDYAVSTLPFDLDRHGAAGEIWWIRVADMSRLDLGSFALAGGRAAATSYVPKMDFSPVAAQLGFSPALKRGQISIAEAQPPICAVF